MPPALVRSRRLATILGLAASIAGTAGCSLGGESTLPAFTRPAAITYAASTNVNLANMTALNEQLYVQDVVVGTGRTVAVGDSLSVYYSGKLNSGFQFDARQSPSTPFETALDSTRLIRGWVNGLPGARVGGTRRLVIGPQLGYQYSAVRDNQGNLLIPSNSVLIFEVQIVNAAPR